MFVFRWYGGNWVFTNLHPISAHGSFILGYDYKSSRWCKTVGELSEEIKITRRTFIAKLYRLTVDYEY